MPAAQGFTAYAPTPPLLVRKCLLAKMGDGGEEGAYKRGTMIFRDNACAIDALRMTTTTTAAAAVAAGGAAADHFGGDTLRHKALAKTESYLSYCCHWVACPLKPQERMRTLSVNYV